MLIFCDNSPVVLTDGLPIGLPHMCREEILSNIAAQNQTLSKLPSLNEIFGEWTMSMGLEVEYCEQQKLES